MKKTISKRAQSIMARCSRRLLVKSAPIRFAFLKRIVTVTVAITVASCAHAQQLINLGTTSDDGTGDDLRAAGAKINTNFLDLYQRAVTNISEGNVLHVRTNGNNSTAVKGRLDKPWATLMSAKAAAVAGDLINVGGGLYSNQTNLLKNGVNWIGSGVVLSNNYTADVGAWDNTYEGNPAAITSHIVMEMTFIDNASVSVGNIVRGSALTLSNPLSRVTFQCSKILNLLGDLDAGIRHFGGRLIFDVPEWDFDAGGSPLYWGEGNEDVYGRWSVMNASTDSPIWVEGAGRGNWYLTFETMDSVRSDGTGGAAAIYFKPSGVQKLWLTGKEIIGASVAVGYGGVLTVETGRVYMGVQKISAIEDTSVARALVQVDSGEAWVETQKSTVTNNQHHLSQTGGHLKWQSMEFDDAGIGSSTRPYNFIQTGGTNLIEGGLATTRWGPFYKSSGGRSVWKGLTVDTTPTAQDTNYAVWLNGGTVVLQDVSAVVSGTNSVFASSGQTLDLHGSFTANRGFAPTVSIRAVTNYFGGLHNIGFFTNSDTVRFGDTLWVRQDVNVGGDLNVQVSIFGTDVFMSGVVEVADAVYGAGWNGSIEVPTKNALYDKIETLGSTFLPSGMFLRGTNRWFDGGISSLYTNTFVANLGGVSNILATNILSGQIVRLEFLVEPGVSVGFPQFTAAQWGGFLPFFATNAGLWNIIEVSVPGAGITNARHSVEGFELTNGANITLTRDYVTRTLSIASTGGGGSSAQLSYVDIRDYGAVGDDSTDNKVSISNAIAAATSSNLWVLVPPGRYRSTPLITTASIFGFGTNSELVFYPSNSAGTLLTANGNVSLNNFALDGLCRSNFYGNVLAGGTRIGVSHYGIGPSVVSKLFIRGFDLTGLQITGPNALERNTPYYTDNFVWNCGFGISNVLGTAEYSTIRGNRLWSNTLGMVIRSANSRVLYNEITDCYRGATADTGGDGRGHQEWIGNVFNHINDTPNAVHIKDITTGLEFLHNRALPSGSLIMDNVDDCRVSFNKGFSIDADIDCNVNQFNDNTDVGGIIDYTGKLVHWNNRDTAGALIDGTGAPYYAMGGYGLENQTNLMMRGFVTTTYGVHYPSNTVTTAAMVTTKLTNGGFWAGTMSNGLQAAWMSNNVTLWKVLAP